MWTVYIHINKENGKKYVGITSTDVKRRWKNGYGYAENLPIGRAIRKYGWDSFEHVVLSEGLSESEAKQTEISLIKELNTQDRDRGYNLTAGGGGITGWRHSDEAKAKMKEAAKTRCGDKNPNYNNRWTDEQKAEASKRHMRSELSQETLAKMSASAKRRFGERNPFFGKKHTDKTKSKLSALRSRPVVMFDKNDKYIKEFSSIKTAALELGISNVGISNCCRGVSNTSGGYKWKYKDSL